MHDDPRLTAFGAAESAYFEQETAGKIPAFKFSSNDGWCVTPAEIRRSLAVLDELGTDGCERLRREWPQQIDRFWEFVEWLRRAVEVGGFQVC